MIRTLLIANRGEVACRILATCARLGIRGVVVYSEADASSLAVRLADEAVLIGPAPASQSYLDIDAVLGAAKLCGADAVHPGYGFLAENADFARRVNEAGLIFVGPSSEVIARMGSKVAARKLCQSLGLPTIPGSGALSDEELLEWADRHDYPVMLKASAGGGGKGMRRLFHRTELESALVSVRREAAMAFGSDEVYLEKALVQPRHLEVQVASDHFGNHIHLGIRECSLQRRHQKIIEECPPAKLSTGVADALTGAALKLVRQVGYSSLGTVEFLVSGDDHYFLEMNTRLQVEHPVTEAVTGLDLVELQLSIAEDRRLPIAQSEVVFRGHAVEARVTCENPENGFLPATGPLLHWSPSFRARVDTGIESGGAISPHYDSMVAKVICWGEERSAALRRLEWSLRNTVLLGVQTNLDFLLGLLREPAVSKGETHTELVESLSFVPSSRTVRQLLAVAAARHAAEAVDGGRPSMGAFPAKMRFEDQPEVRVSGRRFEIEGRVYEVELWAGTLIVDGHRTPATVAQDGPRWWVHTPEGTTCLLATPRYPLQDLQGSAGSLKAPMPGSVVEIMVAVGQRVGAGEPLLKLEAMKMEHIICAPTDGLVRALPYLVGDQVEVGVELVGLGVETA